MPQTLEIHPGNPRAFQEQKIELQMNWKLLISLMVWQPAETYFRNGSRRLTCDAFGALADPGRFGGARVYDF